ncbi:MAG TPA: ATP-binding cassette domain-containing protein [Candidatus Limnocylindrales bacterium]|nr:ATP-binding cassette domain-containing protein [Candidatus Limnocylindrales bacterium]
MADVAGGVTGREAEAVLRLSGVAVRRSGRTILGPINWRIGAGERWVVLGPNGSGKTTLVHVASTYLWPTTGAVEVLGATIGRVDARELRRRIGYAGSGLEAQFDPGLTALDIVVTARHAALGPWWNEFTAADRDRARELLGQLGIGGLADHAYRLLSTGERRRVQIARALMPDPELLILDEPGSSLDLGARETLVRDLGRLAGRPSPRAVVLVTHHVEEIPAGFGHALVLSEGRAVAAGPIDAVITGSVLGRAFGLPIAAERVGGRFRAWLDGDEHA